MDMIDTSVDVAIRLLLETSKKISKEGGELSWKQLENVSKKLEKN